MVAIDATACRMVVLPIQRVENVEAARDKGLGAFEEGRIEIRQKSVEEVRKKLYVPYLDRFVDAGRP
jgi:hypothetical protein